MNQTLQSKTNEKPVSSEHDYQDGWKWSADLAKFIADRSKGHTLKIGTGKCPIGTVNLDIGDISEFAADENADFRVDDIANSDQLATFLKDEIEDGCENKLYGRIKPDPPKGADDEAYELLNGYALRADMFNVPFERTFETVILDPPWKDLTLEQRMEILRQAAKATTISGTIILNATWSPETIGTRCEVYEERFRQQRDGFGGTSLLTFYEVTPQNLTDLLKMHSDDGTTVESLLPILDAHPQSVSIKHRTDPRLPSVNHPSYCCPMCGCNQLDQQRGTVSQNEDDEYKLYECYNCQYPAHHSEILRLADKLQAKADKLDCSIHEIEHLTYTPNTVKCHQAEEHTELPVSDLPWVPTHTESTNNTSKSKNSEDTNDKDTLPYQKVNPDLHQTLDELKA